MNRRDFLRAASAGGGLLAMPAWSWANASSGLVTRPLTILRPAALPEAVALATAIAAAMAADGLPAARVVDCCGGDAAALSAAFAADGGSVLGVMQPSGAVVAVALASAHGLGLRWQGQHRLADGAVRHLSSFILDR